MRRDFEIRWKRNFLVVPMSLDLPINFGVTHCIWWFERYAGCSSRPKCVLVQVETPEVTGPALRSEFSKISRCSLRRPLFLLTSNLFLLTTKKCFQNLDQYHLSKVFTITWSTTFFQWNSWLWFHRKSVPFFAFL